MCRAIVLEFQPLDKVYKGAEKVAIFQELRQAQACSSSDIGQLIQLSHRVVSAEGFRELDETVAVEVSDVLDHSLPRMTETYSIWLYATLQVM